MIGVVPTKDALLRAEGVGLDLIEVSPNAEPPLCKIIDYGKYKYSLQKRKSEAKKNQKVVSVKEVKLSLRIEENDYIVKYKRVVKFLNEGNKVKVSLRFRGREAEHPELGLNTLKRITDDLTTAEVEYKVDQKAKREGRQMMMVLSANT